MDSPIEISVMNCTDVLLQVKLIPFDNEKNQTLILLKAESRRACVGQTLGPSCVLKQNTGCFFLSAVQIVLLGKKLYNCG